MLFTMDPCYGKRNYKFRNKNQVLVASRFHLKINPHDTSGIVRQSLVGDNKFLICHIGLQLGHSDFQGGRKRILSAADCSSQARICRKLA